MIHFFLRTVIIFSLLFLTGLSVTAQHSKTCGSDHMTELIKQQFPEHAEAWEDFHQRVIPGLVENQPTGQRTAAPILRIPIVVHVIHSGEPVGTGSNLSDAQIQAQLDVLNEDFSAQNANFNQTPSQWTSVIGNPDIQFCLANVDPSGNPTNGITRHNIMVTGTSSNDSNIEDEIKPATTWNSDLYYNIWTLPIPGTTANGGVVGYAYLPSNFAIGSDFDGSVVDWRWFGGPGFSQSGFKTLTHETGHYLGLPHTFNEDDCNGDDNIDDTPNVSAATASLIPSLSCSNNNFPTGPNSCGEEHMYVNYMDYVNVDFCYTSFTQGQIAVMRGVLEGNAPFNYGSRLALVNNSNTACASAANNIGITSVIQPTAGTNCTPGPVTPEVTVGNFGTETVTTFSVSYQVDNGTLITENFVDNIASGATVTVSLPVFTPPTSTYNFTAFTQNPNGVTDTQTDNDTASITSTLVTPQALPLLEEFTATSIDPTAAGSYPFNPDADEFAWQHVPTSANGSTGGSILFDNYEGSNTNNPFGTIDAFISPVLDLSNRTNTSLTFDVAYARYDNGGGSFFNDSLRVLVSTDCGSNYNELVFNEGGAILETGSATSSPFTPSANEWGSRTIDLSTYDGQAAISIAFVNISGWGNRLFLDNINITATEITCDLMANVSTTDAFCFQDISGTAQAFPQGGTAPYTYFWNNQMTDPTIISEAGIFSVTITDATGCSATASGEILEPAPINFEINKTDETVAGANDGTATTVVSGGVPGYSYMWSNQATTPSVSNLAPGNYSVTVSDQNGCDEEISFIIQSGAIDCDLVVTVATTDALCYQDNSGTAQVFIEGGRAPYTYLWHNQMTDQTILSGAGVVSVTITDANNCTTIATSEILEPAPISFGINKTDETIAGANDGTATTVVSGGTPGYTFIWSNQATTSSVSNLAPGDYTVTVTDQNLCNKEVSFLIEPGQADCSQLSLVLQPTATNCADSNNGSVNATASGGTGAYQYSWSNGMSTQNINNLSTGTYRLTITDQQGCSLSKTTIVNAPPALTAMMSTTENEIGSAPPNGSATVNVSGGVGNYIYQWSNGESTATIIGLSAGTYAVTVFDSNQCEWIGAVEVENEMLDCTSLAIAINSENISCNGAADGFINALGSGGTAEYIYQWSNGMNTATITDLDAGTYQVTITDVNGCSVAESIQITEAAPIVPNLTAISDPCNSIGGTLSVNPSGGMSGYQISWSNGVTGFTNEVLQSGNYQVTIIDAAGCTVTDATNITVSETVMELVVNTENTSCSDENDGTATVIINGGTAPYTYFWSSGDTQSTATGLSAGTYLVEITDAMGCERSQIFTVNDPAPIILSCSGTPENNGADGFIQVSGSGGTAPYQYNWSTGDTGSFVQGISNGIYDVTVTDQNGCTSECTIDLLPTSTEVPADFTKIIVFPNPVSEQLFVQADLLESETVQISMVNLVGQTIWATTSNGTTINQTIDVDNLAAGTYFLRLETTNSTAIRKVVIF